MAEIERIERVDVNNLKEYENNTKTHPREQIEALKKSIEEFGFVNPVLIDNEFRIIAGHGRVLAAREKGLKEIPCVKVEGLTDEQRRAYIIADNKLSELGGWDNEKLLNEIGELYSIDMETIGFNADFEEQLERLVMPGSAGRESNDISGQYYGDERERTLNAVNLNQFDDKRCYGLYDIPTLKSCDIVPDELIGFNYVLSAKENDYVKGVHFFLDDYQFERIWNKPNYYIEKLRKFKCVFTPDFSPYADMPVAMKIWNVYRNRLVGQIMQDAGLNVIPTLTWSSEDTFDYVIDGVEAGGTVGISTVSIGKYREDEKYRDLFVKGVKKVDEVIKPKTIVLYGSWIPNIDTNAKIVKIKARGFNGG